MYRFQAISRILSKIDNEVIVAANGMISRETYHAQDRVVNFYMLGSMGLASSIGLGIALTRPKRRIIVFDGDGNVLMALGTLAMIADLKPMNLLHVVFDNQIYGSTGGQRSISSTVDLAAIARSAGYVEVSTVNTITELDTSYHFLLSNPGPAFLLVKIEPGNQAQVPRVPLAPERILTRIAASLEE